MTDLSASFERQGDLVVPREFTRSGWSPTMLNGRYLAGMVAWGAEQAQDDPELQPARLTVDMFRPGTMAPARVETTVVREGRRIKVVDTSVIVDGVQICRGTTVFLRRSTEPRGETWFPPEWSAPHPDEVPVRESSFQHDTMPWETRSITQWGDITNPRQIWLRETRPFMEGEELTPFMRAALMADMSNGQINAGPLGLGFINADLTLTLARLPMDEWLGMEGISRATADGVSVGTVDIYDLKGRIGQVTIIGVADERNLAPETT